ncbi:MAG TPA: hypothetical protein PLS95_01175 [Thermoanaerobaculales bacterium]|jgi:hypothetical protein|nr:hypothetical protein [Thermoanaerobaculales bacterium]
MKLGELIDALHDLYDAISETAEGGEDAAENVDVALAVDPERPVALTVGDVVMVEEEDGVPTVYLVEETHLGTLSWAAADALGWLGKE